MFGQAHMFNVVKFRAKLESQTWILWIVEMQRWWSSSFCLYEQSHVILYHTHFCKISSCTKYHCPLIKVCVSPCALQTLFISSEDALMDTRTKSSLYLWFLFRLTLKSHSKFVSLGASLSLNGFWDYMLNEPTFIWQAYIVLYWVKHPIFTLQIQPRKSY